MKRISINIALSLLFAVLATVIILPLIADAKFNAAQVLEHNYRWKKAGENYEEAIKLDVLNAKHLAAHADFMIRQRAYLKNEIAWLQKAEKLYKRALQLNPRCAEYYARLGEIQINSICNMKYETRSMEIYINKALKYLTKAVANDPSGFNTVYSFGYIGMSVWNFLYDKQIELVLDRLRWSLRLKPWYGKYIYPQVWQHAKDFKFLQKVTPNTLDANKRLYYFITANNLCKFYTTQKKVIDFYMEKEKPAEFAREKEDKERLFRALRALAMTGELEDWTGESRGGNNVYKYGKMYWAGTINKAVNTPEGKAIIKIQAKGSQANGIWPYMIVELDGEEMGEIFVDSAEWKEYNFDINTNSDIKVLSVTFANDGTNKLKKEDRNLYVGSVHIVKND